MLALQETQTCCATTVAHDAQPLATRHGLLLSRSSQSARYRREFLVGGEPCQASPCHVALCAGPSCPRQDSGACCIEYTGVSREKPIHAVCGIAMHTGDDVTVGG